MANMSNEMKKWAEIGAAVRLQALNAEHKAILAAFPDLGRGKRTVAPAAAGAPRKRRKMSAKARALISAAMKKRWAERKRKT